MTAARHGRGLEWGVRHVLQYGPEAEVLEPAAFLASYFDGLGIPRLNAEGISRGTISNALDVITFPKGGPVLTAGHKYWLFGFGATGELNGLWHYSSNVLATTRCADGPFPGIGWYSSTCRYPAFQIVVLQ